MIGKDLNDKDLNAAFKATLMKVFNVMKTNKKFQVVFRALKDQLKKSAKNDNEVAQQALREIFTMFFSVPFILRNNKVAQEKLDVLLSFCDVFLVLFNLNDSRHRQNFTLLLDFLIQR